MSTPRTADHDDPAAVTIPAETVLRWFRLSLGIATLVMLALSWRLWIGAGDIPRVPFVHGLDDPRFPAVVFGSILVMIAAATALGAWRSGSGSSIVRRAVMLLDLLSVGLLVRLVLADQHRLQPWTYQYALTALALATMPPARALRGARLFLIALYAYSGLSKLDMSFARELGPVFLGVALHPFGIEASAIPEPWGTLGVLAMPFGEVLVALGLCIPAARRVALVGAVGLHATLLGILGPWGLWHSTIVLVWNAALIVEDIVLFGPRPDGPRTAASQPGWSWIEVPVAGLFLVATIMPLFERWGLWDTWPSFALYASHGERVDIELASGQENRFPASLRAHLGPPDLRGNRRLDVNGWSLEHRGTPLYPQARALLGLAVALAEAPGRPRQVLVTILGRADRLSGRRSSKSLVGLRAIRLRARRCWLNALPSRPVPDPSTAHRMRSEAAND